MGNCLSSCNGKNSTVSDPQPKRPPPPDLAKKLPRPTERLQPDQQPVPAPEIPENSTQDKRVVVQETLRDDIQGTDRPLKENRDVNLLEPVKASQRREFCGKPVNGIETKRQSGCQKIPVKRQSREEIHVALVFVRILHFKNRMFGVTSSKCFFPFRISMAVEPLKSGILLIQFTTD